MCTPAIPPPPGLSVANLEAPSQATLVLSFPLRADLPLQRLSDSEAAVILLALQGLSNLEIAGVRATSPRTVANQLASAYRKLGGVSRACLKAVPQQNQAAL